MFRSQTLQETSVPAWIYRATGRESAPISRDALERLIKGGQLNGKALIRRSMDAKWLAIANTEFSSLLPKPAERPTAPRPHLLSLLRNDLPRVRFTKEQIVSAIVFAILFTPVACVMEMHNNYVAEVKIKEAAAADFHTRVIDLGRLGDIMLRLATPQIRPRTLWIKRSLRTRIESGYVESFLTDVFLPGTAVFMI
jgi:hypothetical protein